MRPVQLRPRGRRPDEALRAQTKTLLVELPFKTFSRPSIGLSLLKASLERAGYPCQIRYANIELAARVGLRTYRVIAEEVPEPLLLGDLIFAPAVDERRGRFEELRDRGTLFLDDGSPIGTAPDWLWRRMPALQREAASFAERCAEEIARTDAAVVGFSCMFQTLPSLAVAKALKARAPEKIIVFGGSHCEGEMGVALHEVYPFIDFVARGESELLLVELLDALAGGDPRFEAIDGLVYREGGRSRATGESSRRVEDLDSLPRPSYDDWMDQLRRAAPSLALTELELPFEASRGCWYGEKHHCTFCGLNGESMIYRRKSPERTLDEIRDLGRYKIPFLYAVDLILDHRYFDTLLPALAREDFDHSIFYETKSNLTRRQVELLRDARVLVIQPGIESLSTDVLALMRKGVTGLQNVRLLKWAAEHGIAVMWALLYGFPREEAESYRAQGELIPSLTHLAPPLGGYKVRADRYSPLFFDSEALGAARPRPSPAYALAHAAPSEVVERLAYHFDIPDDGRNGAYLEPLTAAIRAWRGASGRSSFVSLDRGGALRLYDRRPVAREAEIQLTGVERSVYLGCDAGATPAALAKSLNEPEARVLAALTSFVERRLAAELDGRFLSLAVPMDSVVPDGLPDAVLPSIAHAFYGRRMESAVRALSRDCPTDEWGREDAPQP